jgi:hypothetical protein
VAGAVYIDIDGALTPAYYGIDRPDVAASHGDPQLARSGFSAVVDARALSPGLHRMSLKILTADLRGYHSPPQSVTLDVQRSAGP